MRLRKGTIRELGQILSKEFNTELNKRDLENLANSLVGYFDLLQKIDSRHKFGNRPDRAIDSNRDSVLDKEEIK